jgi:hypothetical protein
MKKLILALITATAFATLIGCAGTNYIEATPQEIDQFLAMGNVPDFDKACLLDGEYKVGMRANTLKFMMGDPKSIEVVKQPWATQEVWFYKNNGKKWFTIEDDGVVGIEQE